MRRGDKIGVMGATGNVTGPHLHLGLRYADAAGNPANASNGFQGFVDPAPALQALDALEQAALNRAKAGKPWMPVNNQAALWKYAQANGLQDQQSDELSFTYNDEQYLAQVFNLGIVYVKVGQWDKIMVIRK